MSSAIALPPASAPTSATSARTRLLLEGPIFATLLRLSGPNVLNLLAITGLITFDGLYVARLGSDSLAGVSLVFPFVMFVQHVAASGMGGAVSSAVARALGAGSPERARTLAAHALVLALGMGLLFSALMLGAGPWIYRAMGGRGAVLEAALGYSTVAFSGVTAVVVLNILANVVRGTGNMLFPAAVLVSVVLFHALLAPVLIFGWAPAPALGVAGAGWSLVISFTAGSVVVVGYLLSPRSLIKLPFAGVRYEWTPIRELLRVGVPGMMNVAITNLSVVLLTGVAARLGRDAAIGYAIGARLEYIMIPIAFGFGTALVALIGTNWGAKQFERAQRIAWIGGITVAVACGSVGLFFALFPELWVGLFTQNEAVAHHGVLFLRVVAGVYWAYGLGMALYFAMQGIGTLIPAVSVNLLRLVVSAGGATVLVTWFGAGANAVFMSIAVGFAIYGLAMALLLGPAMRRSASSLGCS